VVPWSWSRKVTGKRIFWTAGLSIAGLFLGLKGVDTSSDLWWTASTVIWAGSIGYCFGAIFDRKKPTRHPVLCWSAGLAFVGAFGGLVVGAGMEPYATRIHFFFHVLVGALAGLLLGLLPGRAQMRRTRRASENAPV
jgi:hypothetical protein